MIFIAKLIVFSHSINDSTHAANLIQYIATREGVEFNIAEFKGEVTKKQEDLIEDMINKFSYLKEIEEYNNFLKEKSKANASEFLTEAFNLIDDQLATKEVYLKYISERPRVERIHTHGLFNFDGEADLDKETENIKNHEGVVWTHIISLKREDAERLSYDNLKQWQLLLKTKMPKIAQSMNIELKNLVWNAAFHNEGHHPHIHLVMYSKDVKQGYLNKEGIKKIKSVLMNEIYKEELLQIKEEKTLAGKELTEEFSKELDKIYENIVTKNYNVDKKLVDDFIELSKILPDKGKMAYAYQPKEVKEQIDKIVESITENKNIKLLYDKYQECKKDMAAYYSSKEYEPKDITKDREFRNLQNMITKTADKFRKIDLENNEEITDIHEAASTDTIGERLIKLDAEKKELETSYKERQEKRNKEIALNLSSREDVRKHNLKEEAEEVIESRKKSVTAMEKRFLTVLDKYNSGNELFKAELEAVEGSLQGENSLKQFDNLNFETQKHIMKALALIVSDPDINGDYEKYKEACENYNLLSGGNASDYSDLKNMANELVNTVKYNIDLRENEIIENKEKSVAAMESKFLIVLDKYNLSNESFKAELKALEGNLKEKHFLMRFDDLNLEAQKHIMKALALVVSDPDIKNDYENYKKACEEYNMLSSGNASDYSDLKNMANELINTVKYNIAIEKKEIERLSVIIEKNVKTMEKKFLPVLDEYNKNNAEFINALINVSKFKNNYAYDVRNESTKVNACVRAALDIVLNNPEIKEIYKVYKENCEKYSEMVEEDKNKVIDEGLLKMKNKVLNLLNYKSDSVNFGNEIEDKIVGGAKKIKDNYSLSPHINVNYNDYSKQDQEALKYAVKSIVFDIVDSLYFLAREEEGQKNKLIGLNRKINNDRKQEQQSKLTY